MGTSPPTAMAVTHQVLQVDATGSAMNSASATLPPWLAWSNGLVYGQRVYKSNLERFPPVERSHHRPRLTIYTYGHDNQPIFRLSGWSEGSGAGAGADGVSAAPPGVGAGPVRWERVPLDREPWHVDVPIPIQPPALDRPGRYDHSDVDYSPPMPASEGLHAWSGVLRGWAAGATLLALLVVIARAAEKCLDWKFLRRRRRLHQEWQRRNGYPHTEGRVTFPGLENEHPLPANLSEMCAADPPPPYSELTPASRTAAAPGAGSGALKADERIEEPPPPYSDAFVHFVNKNGVPVLVYGRARSTPAPADEPARLGVDRILEACGVRVALDTPAHINDGPPPPNDIAAPIQNTGTGNGEINENSTVTNLPKPNMSANPAIAGNEATEAPNPNNDTTIDMSVTDENSVDVKAKRSDPAPKHTRTDDDDPPKGGSILV